MDLSHLVLLICAVVAAVYVSQSGVYGVVVLGTTNCTSPADCSAVKNATCGTTSKKCECSGTYKKVNDTCVLNGLSDMCAADKDCPIASHLTCDTSKCTCKSDFKVDGGKCIPTVLGTTNCTSPADCSAVKNAICGTTSKKCECSDTYKKVNDTCVLNGLSDKCVADKDCPSASHLTCDTSKCTCKSDFKVDGGKCIPNVIGTPCTNATVASTCKVKNSFCNATKCACKTGFKNTDDTCTLQESSASSIKIALSTLGTVMMLNVILKLF